jgi:hypothetical protein
VPIETRLEESQAVGITGDERPETSDRGSGRGAKRTRRGEFGEEYEREWICRRDWKEVEAARDE